MLPIYKEKKHLVYRLNPLAQALWFSSVFFLALVFNHPVYTLALLALVSVMILDTDNLREWRGYLRLSLLMLVMILVVNALFVKAGRTVIYAGPTVPLVGGVRITLEALAYGMAMGFKLMLIMSLLCLFTYSVQPDRFMKLLRPLGGKTVFVVVFSLRMFPLLMQDFNRIMEVQKCRGVLMETGTLKQRIAGIHPLVGVLLLSSLERAFKQAESMVARGYGSGEVTAYKREVWHLRDTLVAWGTVLGLVSGFAALVSGMAFFEYYPRMTRPGPVTVWPAVTMVLGFLTPALMERGLRIWPTLKSRI
jgi:energy-coupling factor transport system permease protein